MTTTLTPVNLPLQGAPGVAAPQIGFGQITYTNVPTPPILYAPDVRVQLMFPAGTPQNYLNAPFIGQTFWDGAKINARAMYDLLYVQINLLVTSLVANGNIQIDLDAGSSIGPLVSDTATLFAPAGTQERVTLDANVQCLTSGLANGIKIFIRNTVPIHIARQSILVAPYSTHTQ